MLCGCETDLIQSPNICLCHCWLWKDRSSLSGCCQPADRHKDLNQMWISIDKALGKKYFSPFKQIWYSSGMKQLCNVRNYKGNGITGSSWRFLATDWANKRNQMQCGVSWVILDAGESSRLTFRPDTLVETLKSQQRAYTYELITSSNTFFVPKWDASLYLCQDQVAFLR